MLFMSSKVFVCPERAFAEKAGDFAERFRRL
jgi:hypothetical protein